MNGKLIPSKESSTQPTSIEDIFESIKYFRRRMLVHDGWNYVQSTMWIIAAFLLIGLIIGRIWPIDYLERISFGFGIFWLFSIGIHVILVPKKPMTVAWRVDQDLKIKERLSSAIKFSENNNSKDNFEGTLIAKQLTDTFFTIKSIDRKSTFKLDFSLRHFIGTILISSAAVILIAIPNPMTAIIQQREAIAASAIEQAETIEDLIEEIENDGQLSPEEKEKLFLQLESLAEKLRQNQGDLSEALAELSRTEQELLDRIDPQLDFKRTALNSITQQLSDLAKVGQNELDNDPKLDEIMGALANQITSMDQNVLHSLSQSLQKMAAQAAQAGEAGLAESLSALSQSILSADTESALQNGEQVSQSLNQAQTELTNQQSFEKALSQLQQSRMALSQTGAIAGNSGQNQNQGNQTSQGQNPNQGENPGTGQGQGNTAGGGGGTKANSLPGFTGSGQPNNPTGSGQSSSDGLLEDQIYVPWERLQGNNESISIFGQDSGQGQTEVNEQDLPMPGTVSPSLIPYTEVYGNYMITAYETIENSYIPIGLKDYVLRYFSLLEP